MSFFRLSGSVSTRRDFVRTAAWLLVGGAHKVAWPETPTTVRTVFLAPTQYGPAEAVRKGVARKLASSGLVRLVGEESGADSTLRIKTVVWPIGTIAVNPRAPSNSYTTYQGYASAELEGSNHATLWSYLATPGRFQAGGLTKDLADQLSANLLAALEHGLSSDASPGIDGAATAGAGTGVSLRAAGATFPAPLYVKWFESFAAQAGGVPISYAAVGSTAGRQQLAEGRVDLAASDIPAIAGDAEPGLLRVPTVIGGIVPIYNLHSVHDLHLTAEVLAAIYAGQIRRWNDPRIREGNKSEHLPDAEIEVVHRSDGSGTSYVWTHFLGMAGGAWTLGADASPAWPVGTGAAGNQGVAEMVTRTPNALGYVELTYAIQQHLAAAAVRNPAGVFVHAELSSITAAAEQASSPGRDLGLSMLNAPGKDAYPITTFTWLLAHRDNTDAPKRTEIAGFLRWMLTSGQKQCAGLGYAPLPRRLAEAQLRALDGWK